MINLKQILQEVTDHNFQMKYVKDKNPMKVIDHLQDLGFGLGRGDVAAGKMFKHIQYHVGHDGKGSDVYFIHQTQHYLNDRDVDVTQVVLKKYVKGYERTTDKKVEIGRALVPTKKFLKGLKRLVILDRAS